MTHTYQAEAVDDRRDDAAANRPAIEMLATTPMRIRSMVGGMRVAVAPAEASSAVENGSG